ncbi:hypothetical protein M409DRAFT_54546 [Zasmidium cellare ATCC 36951]|uniref:Uncharacterized protein n=1 Tax=Zasmidium cellare ATCC 36951 TaxID=1080233 RepID=A0A6A6CMT1_ZASCE|nr:uncharacterized protein M409DRAFT_54546 [Zasmidium cellare ATCC 36951]KAF2166756.1 hypothetical protein M409DRAFT_54546 [Zasmidium cellare ATCC 36951]
MAQLPDRIRAFRDRIRTMNLQDLNLHFIDLSENERTVTAPLLKVNHQLGQQLQDSYPSIQSGFFDYTGHCQMGCPMDQMHVHSIQARGGVLQVEGFPGVYVYPEMLVPVLPELLDEVMDLEQTPEAKDLEYVLHTGHEGARCRQVVPPGKLSGVICDAFPSMFKINRAKSATLSVSTPEHMVGMRRPNGQRGIIAHVSLGCDAVIVLGTEKPEYEGGSADEPAEQDEAVQADSWHDLVDLDRNADESPVRPPSQSSDRLSSPAATSFKPELPLALAAIQLRAGDALIFDNRGCATWYGLAKVLEGSSRLDPQWPHLREDSQDSGIRGQLNGKTVEIEFQ